MRRPASERPHHKVLIIAERGFSQVTIAELARELHCSAATLYKIAPSKDSLILLAIARWAEVVFLRAGAEHTHSLSLAFYAASGGQPNDERRGLPSPTPQQPVVSPCAAGHLQPMD